MTAYAFTGSRECSISDTLILNGVIKELEDATCFISGAQFGIDSQAAFAAWCHFPNARHIIVVPAAPHDKDLVLWAEHEGIEILWMPEVQTDAIAYMERNQYMVDMANHVLAFPRTAKEKFRGSGTWATIRRARKKGIPVSIYPLGA